MGQGPKTGPPPQRFPNREVAPAGRRIIGPVTLRFETRLAGQVAVIRCFGPLVFGERATELHIAAKQQLGEKRAVLLDLAGLTSIDSAGVGTLFAIYTSSLGSYSEVALCSLTPLVRHVLQTSMLLPLLKTYPDREQALAALTSVAR